MRLSFSVFRLSFSIPLRDLRKAFPRGRGFEPSKYGTNVYSGVMGGGGKGEGNQSNKKIKSRDFSTRGRYSWNLQKWKKKKS